MTKYTSLLLFILTTLSCSEGDIITTTIDFEGDLQYCANTSSNTFVFYSIDQNNKQSSSVNFTSTTYTLEPTAEAISEDPTESITLNATTNQFIYREFNTAIVGTEYFCKSIPPSNISVSQELISNNGTVEINYTIIEDTDLQTTYTRTITLKNITLDGDDISIRRELLILGSDTYTITK